ncbi:indolepyruvate ferredoxin oxidoreductase family protein [Burkholderiaceae bacterium FT117]|uniref:indolepyruvate ferredoxin oxidoreductase family protein n=1 Tax=Zeimonas sediminis TaxID=2944268 RepID=UPI002342F24C|nr:indolepyruvate ferredoxin oxidoreductase family protein [Zeimonas sediminis]MCM5569762.1 indolepyruvate ferredoxin oxidoreductase family protein [Zeimonas sediminis]
MNAPLDPAFRQVTLEDKYEAREGAVYITGTQALVRLPLMQRQRDLAAGLNTAGYISGYRGSPVGGFDQALWKARKHLEKHHVKFVPGVNEDLAATAIWGTQQLNEFPGAKYDGVFGIWYGKGPGVDRSGDALRHANQAGTSRHGGVLAVGGDDHGAKSSTMAAQTDFIFKAVSMPVLAPATVQDYVDLGLQGFAMSRYSGLWVGFKAVTDTIEVAGIVDVSPDRLQLVTPEGVAMPEGGLNLRWPEEPFLKMEERLTRWKIPAALAWARANRLDRNVFGRPDGEPARLGIVSTGKSWLDTMQALADLGIDDATAKAIGLRVYKVAMPWPLEPEGIREFCAGCEEILVIEEKRSLIEAQLKEHLYALDWRPRIVGKLDERGATMLPEWGELTPAICARTIVARLRRSNEVGADERGGRLEDVLARCDAQLARIDAREQALAAQPPSIERIPYFCSGCPHNTSTRVPEGSRALAGIGCHYMSMWMDRSTATFTHMGAEGTSWVGQFPFSETKHVFQNLGDGTYFHSGSLAIRQAVAAKTPITYKILFNDAVAMTGGQKHDGQLSPRMIARQVAAEGVEKIVVVTDEPDKYPAGYFEAGIPVYHRSKLDEVQRELREYPGVSVLIYDQTCAAEKRRRRKRGEFPDPPKRAFINEAVCEGCGDCGVQSNCVSIEPVETEFGRKRKINQSACNKDFSCVNGFCPSFVTVHGGKLRRGIGVAGGAGQGAGSGAMSGGAAAAQAGAPATVKTPIAQSLAEGLTAAALPSIDGSWAMLITGIGGTGVVTIGALLGMAAHLEGKNVTVLDVAGLAQKNGAVMSYVRFGKSGEPLYAPRIGTASADAVLGCDIVVTAGREALARMVPGRTRVVANVASTPTADFTRNADWKFPLGEMEAKIVEAVGDRAAADFIDGQRLATALLGDAIATNLFMLGYAWQRGLVPVSAEAIERAIELNEVAIEQNKAAFAWGRVAAVDPERVEKAAAPVTAISIVRKPAPVSLDDLIAQRAEFLTGYQNARYARRFTELVAKVREAEKRVVGEGAALKLTEAVARYYSKLMAYKDEYEVARLYTDGRFLEKLNRQFEGDFRLGFHLAPPLLAKRNARGELVKAEYGPWVFKAFGILAKLKGLRGTPLDVFGRTEERRTERALIDEYRRTIEGLLGRLDRDKLSIAVQIASVPEEIRGYGHVKERNLAAAKARRAELLQAFEAARPLQAAA